MYRSLPTSSNVGCGLIDHSHTNTYDRSWGGFWANQRGWKRDLLLTGSRHHSYTDLQAILPQLTEPLGFPANKWEPVLGTIAPAQSLHTQETRIETFLDCFLR
jgi:hypothetical protein